MSARDRGKLPDLVIPADRLPPGFAQRIEHPPAEPVPALPAATAVLLRDGAALEVLLLRRNRTTGFVPGAYVFPGGRVDAGDGDSGLLERVDGGVFALPAESDERTSTSTSTSTITNTSTSTQVPFQYWMAAAREVLEEAGVLLSRNVVDEAEVAEWRDALLEDRATLLDVLVALDARLDLRDMVYCAHWVTPLAEQRRYDTRFFLAALPSGRTVSPDAREMTDAVWFTPAAALARFHDGMLPMVFPTVKTLESLARFTTVADALDAFREREIVTVLPRLVRLEGGVGIVIDEQDPSLREL